MVGGATLLSNSSAKGSNAEGNVGVLRHLFFLPHGKNSLVKPRISGLVSEIVTHSARVFLVTITALEICGFTSEFFP